MLVHWNLWLSQSIILQAQCRIRYLRDWRESGDNCSYMQTNICLFPNDNNFSLQGIWRIYVVSLSSSSSQFILLYTNNWVCLYANNVCGGDNNPISALRLHLCATYNNVLVARSGSWEFKESGHKQRGMYHVHMQTLHTDSQRKLLMFWAYVNTTAVLADGCAVFITTSDENWITEYLHDIWTSAAVKRSGVR